MKKLQGGIIGAGKDSFIGFVHMAAARLMGQAEITAGVFSRDPRKGRERGETLGIAPDRIYGNYIEMVSKESALPENERIDFIIITTPNSSHYDMTMAFLDAGIHVFSDKPMAVSPKQARTIQSRVEETGLLFALTHGYTGYAMVKQARHLVESGKLGRIHRVVVEYTQGWLSSLVDNPELFTTWHLDPGISGPSCTMMDVGIHALNLVQTITGLTPQRICADLKGSIPGNPLDDQGSVMMHFNETARGLLHASQVSSGEGNALRIRVYGSKAGLSWDQEYPETLEMMNSDGSSTVFKKGTPALCEEALKASRLPAGHPEGLISAFANIYDSGFHYILQDKGVNGGRDYPDVSQGVAGLSFIDAIIKNNSGDTKWTEVEC